MDNFCRLCAEEKAPEELAFRFDDEILNIEQKLIDCCRWKAFLGDEHDGLPKRICIVCFQRLEQSWEFAESVAQAQQAFNTNTTDPKPIVLLQIEKVEIPLNDDQYKYGVTEEFHEFIDSHDSILSPPIDYDEIVREESIYKCAVEDDKKPNNNDSSIIENHNKLKITKIDFDLLALLLDSEKNTDGTVNKEKIGQLNLDDWSLVKWDCWVCKAKDFILNSFQLKYTFTYSIFICYGDWCLTFH